MLESALNVDNDAQLGSTWKKSRLKYSDQKPQCNDRGSILDSCKSNRQSTSCKEKDTQPERRPNVMLHRPVTRNLENCICDGEQGDCQSIAVRGQTSDLEHVIVCFGVQYPGIANVSWKKLEA